MEFVRFSDDHLHGVLRLCEAEGWPSLPSDPERARRALAGPAVLTVVAVEGSEVLGFAQLLTDGEIQAYLCSIAVDVRWRRRGVGRRLVEEGLRYAGAERMDLLAIDGSEAFYRCFDHRTLPGYRIYTGGSAPRR